MHVEHHRWYSPRLNRDMDILVYGHYGLPLLVFPTSNADHREYADRSMIGEMAWHIDQGRVKVFCVNAVNAEGWNNKAAHPAHRTWLQTQYDGYIASEVAPFIQNHCQSPGITITTTGSSFGAYHAANSVLKHPDVFQRCIAMSGVYDMRRLADGHYDDNLYYNNPVDYIPGLNDPYLLHHLHRAEIRLVTGSGPYEESGPTYALSEVLSRKGIPHFVDNWGPDGGHDWPYWKKQMHSYVNGMF